MKKTQSASTLSATKIKPLFDYVLVRPLLEQSNVTPSGIVLPDSAKEKPQVGEIMAVGPGTINDQGKTLPVVVKIGDTALYKKWGGNEVKVGREEWLLLEQKDIMAIVK